jgi:hypothetical protein
MTAIASITSGDVGDFLKIMVYIGLVNTVVDVLK